MFRIRTTVFAALGLALMPFLGIVGASLRAATAKERPDAVAGNPGEWAATRWSLEDTGLFGGFPAYKGAHRNLIVLRYTYYVSYYDADRLCPLWVAHVDYGDGFKKMFDRENSDDPRWSRKGDTFYPDQVLRRFSEDRHLPYVVDRSYTESNPPELPETIEGRKGEPAKITRGHNASNLEMKVEGDEDDGDRAQTESFSLANVSPQMQAHNAPMWAELEKSCLLWAQSEEIGKVAVITGPVFDPQETDPVTGEKTPLPVRRQLETVGEKGPMIPIPTHFFKVVIGSIDGKLSAIGFLIPHLATLKKDDFMRYKVPLEEIEARTKLVFMPDAKIPAFKETVDNRWIQILKAERRAHQKKLKNMAKSEDPAAEQEPER